MERVIRNEWDLLRLDARVDAGDLSEHAMRTRLAMENRLRLDLQVLGLAAKSPKAMTLDQIIARGAWPAQRRRRMGRRVISKGMGATRKLRASGHANTAQAARATREPYSPTAPTVIARVLRQSKMDR
jgi:hypothetical protein